MLGGRPAFDVILGGGTDPFTAAGRPDNRVATGQGAIVTGSRTGHSRPQGPNGPAGATDQVGPVRLWLLRTKFWTVACRAVSSPEAGPRQTTLP